MEGHYASGDKGKVKKRCQQMKWKWKHMGVRGWGSSQGGEGRQKTWKVWGGREEDDGFRESDRSGVCLNACVFVFDKPGSQADCTSRHVPRSCCVAHLLGRSKQAIKEMGQQEKWGPGLKMFCVPRGSHACIKIEAAYWHGIQYTTVKKIFLSKVISRPVVAYMFK